MGVVLARCGKCERLWRAVVYQVPGKRLRNQRSPCCGARSSRVYRNVDARSRQGALLQVPRWERP
jgi:hypothetical protein